MHRLNSCLMAVGLFIAWLAMFPTVCHGEWVTLQDLGNQFAKENPEACLVIGITDPKGRRRFCSGLVTLDGKAQLPDGKTIFEIGSITKLFTGLLLARQVVDGTVKENDPVALHLPDDWSIPQYEGHEIRLVDLATHSSSLPRIPPWLGLHAWMAGEPSNPYANFGTAHLMQTLKTLELKRPIGGKFEYSNLGVGLLGHALVHSAGAESYEALVQQEITGPLSLSDTRVHLSPEQLKRSASGFSISGRPAPAWTFGSMQGAGALHSTVDDLLDFADGIIGSRPGIDPRVIREAQKARFSPNETTSIGFCWFSKVLSEGHWVYYHSGGTGGHSSFFAILPELKMGVVIFANAARPLGEMGFEVCRRVVAAKD